MKHSPSTATSDDFDLESPAVLQAACLEALPIWAKQIETSREQMETAVVSLSGRFSAIVRRLDAVLRGNEENTSAQDIAADASQGEHDLKLVIDALKAIAQSRNTLVQEIRSLATYTEELRGMVSEVESIAFQTNMLALNAAIEAAHAGESGRGFAVVAHEVRSLSTAARDTGKRITAKVGAIGATLQAIGVTNESVAKRDQEAVEISEANIRAVQTWERPSVHRFMRY